MRTLFLTLLLAWLIGGALESVVFRGTPSNIFANEISEDPCESDPNMDCGRLRVPGG